MGTKPTSPFLNTPILKFMEISPLAIFASAFHSVLALIIGLLAPRQFPKLAAHGCQF